MKKLFYALFLFFFSLTLVAVLPIVPDKVFTKEEIDAIHKNNNYFLYKQFKPTDPIWVETNRRYGGHLFTNRTAFLSYPQVVRHVVTDGFPIKYRIQTLFRSQLGIHSQVGSILPSVNVSIGSNVPGFITQAFNGLFGFLSPTTWLSLTDQALTYKAMRHLLVKDVMDQILQAKLAFLTQHQNITDFEILNYYFIHLQILSERYHNISRAIDTLQAEFAVEGTDMASQRGNVKLGFADLALLIALEKLKGDYTVNNFNITLLNDFPHEVKDVENLEDIFKDNNKFLEQVIRKSVELKAVKHFLSIAKINIGIASIGGPLQSITVPNNASSINLAVRLGYGALPSILIARSLEKTAEIDVHSNYLQMLDNARRSFIFYTNSLGGYTEAKRSIEYSRKALKSNIEYLLRTNKEPDALFITALTQTIRAELKLNNALHGSLKALAYMHRFLLIDDLRVLQYLPNREKILKHFNDVKTDYQKQSDREKRLGHILMNARKGKNLQKLFYQRDIYYKDYQFTDEEIVASIIQNIPDLVHNSQSRCKTRNFYKALIQYILEQKIEVSSSERLLLDKHAFGRCEYKKVSKEPYQNFKFKGFSIK